MANLREQLLTLKQSDADVAQILDVYEQIATVYSAALHAMGVPMSKSDYVSSSADVTVSLEPTEAVQSLTLLNG